jgi:hypothetical protein
MPFDRQAALVQRRSFFRPLKLGNHSSQGLSSKLRG